MLPELATRNRNTLAPRSPPASVCQPGRDATVLLGAQRPKALVTRLRKPLETTLPLAGAEE